MTTVQVISVTFLMAVVVLVIRGTRAHPRRNDAVELDSTGRAVGTGAMRTAQRLESDTYGESDGGSGD